MLMASYENSTLTLIQNVTTLIYRYLYKLYLIYRDDTQVTFLLIRLISKCYLIHKF